MWLIGMMGSGKTSAGRALAKRVGEPFHDTDSLVGERAGMSIPELFETIGVTAFRDLEAQAVEAASTGRGVIATGGGVVLHPRLRELMSETGIVVHLSATPETLAERIGSGDGRPLVRDGDTLARVTQIDAERRALYESAADVVIETNGLGHIEVVDELERVWNES